MAIMQSEEPVKPSIIATSVVESTLKKDQLGNSHFRVFDLSFRVLSLKNGAADMVESVERFIESIEMKRPGWAKEPGLKGE